MKKRTESELDRYLEQLENQVPDAFTDNVMKRISADQNRLRGLELVQPPLAGSSMQRLTLRKILEAGLLLVGGSLGFLQAIAFIFGAWSVTTLG